MGKAKKASKRHWKKVQHADVEEFLDIAREKERHDFSSYADDSLFRIDTNRNAPAETEEKSDALVDLTKLKCFQILKPHTNVRDPLIKRNKVKNTSKLQSKNVDPEPPRVTTKQTREINDPWDDTEIVPTGVATDVAEWLSEDTLRVNSSIKKKRMEHKTSELKAITIPHPGFSVNPSFQDHQDLLREALAIEMEEIKREEKINRAVQVPKTAITKEEQERLEDFAGTKDDEDEVDDEEESDKKPVLTKPKTRQQRRREKAVKDKEKIASDLKMIRVRESDVYKIKQFKKELEMEAALRKAKSDAKQAKKVEHDRFGQKALGRYRYEEPKLNPLFSDEITGRLVEAKTGGGADILLDRFKSMQKRNILEVRKKSRPKRLNKLKKYIRPGDKLEWEKTGVWNGIKILQ